MRKTIYKYKLEITDIQSIETPGFPQFLEPQFQNGELFIWAIVEPGKETTKEQIAIYGTGNPVPDDISSDIFLGTIQMGPLVWHIFHKL
jgi:hypothetical protein